MAQGTPLINDGKEIILDRILFITENVTYPAGVLLRVLKGGGFNIAAGKTLTIQGPFEAGLFQVFYGAGQVVFSPGCIEAVIPQWWGVQGNAAADTDDYQALTAMAVSYDTIFFPPGHYRWAGGTVDFTGKRVRGARRSLSAVDQTSGATLLEFGGAAGTPAVHLGGVFNISDVAVVRTGAGKRGVILNLNTPGERTSSLSNLLLAGASYCIFGGTSSNYLYSCLFDNIEFQDWSTDAVYLSCTGATGNVWRNLYGTNWATYPTSKNTARSLINLSGSHTEGHFSQINCEHSGITNACFILNGVEASVWDSVHVEGVEFNGSTQVFNITAGGNRSKTLVRALTVAFCKFLGNDVRAFSVSNTSNDDLYLEVIGFNARNNDLNGTSNHRFAYRGGTIGTNTPAIRAVGCSGDTLITNNYLPIEATTVKPVLELFNGVQYLNPGMGVAQFGWGQKAIDFAGGGAIAGFSTGTTYSTANSYQDGANWKYKATGAAAAHYISSTGGFSILQAVSGNAGTVINWTQPFTLDGNGNLLVGVTSGSSHCLSKAMASDFAAKIINTSATAPSGLQVIFNGASLSGGYFIQCGDTGATRFNVMGSGNCQNVNNVYGAISDIKLKAGIEPAPSYWDKFLGYRFVNYHLKADPAQTKLLGLVAQEAELVSPSVVEETLDMETVQKVEDGKPVFEQMMVAPALLDENGAEILPAVYADDETKPVMVRQPTGTTTKAVKYSVVTLQAEVVLQEAQRRIIELEATVADLAAKLATLLPA